MIHLLLKYPEVSASTRSYELLKTTLDLHGINYTEDPDLYKSATMVITDYFLHEDGANHPDHSRTMQIAESAQRRGIPIIWYYPGESWYTEAVVYNPTGRLASTLTVPTFLIKSGDALSSGDLSGFTKIYNLEQYHIYQVLNNFNLARLQSVRRDMIARPKDKKFLYLNGMAREHRAMLYNEIHVRDLLKHSIWSWKDLKQGTDATGSDPEVNWQTDRLMINQFRYQCVYPEHYARTEFSVVVETAQPEHFVSEKTAKCLVFGHPFVILGSQNFLDKLRSWGYQTFDGVIDQSYDKLHVYDSKPQAIATEVEKLCAQPDVFVRCLEQTTHNMRQSLYLASCVYMDLLDIITDASEGSIAPDSDLNNLSAEKIQGYMNNEL